MKRARSLWIGLLAATAWLPPASATTVIELGEREMTRAADLIVMGRSLESRSEWIGRELYTLTVVEVDEVLKGEATRQVTVVVPGGVDANRRFPVARTYPGAAQILPGQHLVLFLDRSGIAPGGHHVTGFSQGVYTVVEGPDGAPVVRRDLGSLRMLGERPRRGGRTAAPLRLFKARIRAHLAE